MTVREVIEMLQAVEDKDQNLEILMFHNGDSSPIESIDEEDGKVVIY